MICRKCKYEFPHEADRCPRCGRRHAGTTGEQSAKVFALVLLLIAVVLAVHLWQAMPKRSESAEPSKVHTESAPPRPPKTLRPEDDAPRFK